MKIKTKTLWLFFNFVFFLLEIVFLFNIWGKTSFSVPWSYYGFYMTMISICLNLIYVFSAKVPWSDFRVVFVLLSYVFLFGRVWLNHVYPNVQIYWALEDHFTVSNMLKGAVFAACSVQGLFCGLFGFKDKTAENTIEDTNPSEIKADSALWTTGLLLLCISIPCRLYVDVSSIMLVRSTGNYADAVAGSGLFDDLANLIIPGLLCLAESRRTHMWKGIFLAVGIYMALVMTLTGDRRYGVSAILIMLMYHLRLKEKKVKQSKWKLIPIVLFGLLFLNFLDVIRESRLNISGDWFSALKVSNLFDFSDLFVDFFAEFGISYYSVVAIISHVPRILSYQYGMTFLYVIPSVLPVGFLFGDWFSLASPSKIINEAISLPIGATLIGDLYANFGVIIVLFFPLVGKVISRILKPLSKQDRGMSVILYYTKYFLLINFVRCSVFEVFRGVVWCTLIPIVIYHLFNSNKKTGRLYRG